MIGTTLSGSTSTRTPYGCLVFGSLLPSDDSAISTLAAFATFAVGFLARPLGGVLFASRQDKIGRKAVPSPRSLLLMGVASGLIGPPAVVRVDRRTSRSCSSSCGSCRASGRARNWAAPSPRLRASRTRRPGMPALRRFGPGSGCWLLR
ncbi:MHS family MFS transporter [Pseudonocardia sp. MCCB 268]|nr:MHS family MFS transporter [Pseudonocardia cytotoxica]